MTNMTAAILSHGFPASLLPPEQALDLDASEVCGTPDVELQSHNVLLTARPAARPTSI